jgi:hypothetical protein
MPLQDWQNYALGYSTRGVDAAKSAKVIRKWISTYVEEANANIDELLEKRGSGNMDRGDDERLRLLIKRWGQVKDLCLRALEEVE